MFCARGFGESLWTSRQRRPLWSVLVDRGWMLDRAPHFLPRRHFECLYSSQSRQLTDKLCHRWLTWKSFLFCSLSVLEWMYPIVSIAPSSRVSSHASVLSCVKQPHRALRARGVCGRDNAHDSVSDAEPRLRCVALRLKLVVWARGDNLSTDVGGASREDQRDASPSRAG